jgi:lysophospholipase L1-like esterase
MTRSTRRELLATLAAAPLAAELASASPAASRPLLEEGDLVLFQGDSITDAGRSREREGEANDRAALGNGYALLAAAGMHCARPAAKLRFHNRGISGNKVFQLAERWEKDCLDLAPDVLSILIGVNDIWHKRGGHYDGTVETYEEDYDALLTRSWSASPSCCAAARSTIPGSPSSTAIAPPPGAWPRPTARPSCPSTRCSRTPSPSARRSCGPATASTPVRRVPP